MKASRLKRDMDPGDVKGPQGISKWMRKWEAVVGEQGGEFQKDGQAGSQVDDGPIEPDGGKAVRPNIFKWSLFLIVIIYTLLSYYRAPILSGLGGYLIVKHPLKKADLIVCLMGGTVERGLGVADLYKEGMAPHIFIGREELPDGQSVLKEKGVDYPESRDLLIMMLRGLGVPESACLSTEGFAGSTYDEAKLVRDLVLKKGYRILIIVTSPIHTRRSWLTFKKIFEREQVEIMMAATPYTGFEPENWWKTRRYVRDVIIEYEKLAYYTLMYFL